MFNRKNSFCFILACLIAIKFSSCFAENVVESKMPIKEILSHFTTYAEQAKKQWRVPGMAIAIVQGDKIIYAKGFGERDTQGKPVTPETIFHIDSLTKSFTAALLAIQIDEGKYNWNTKIIKLYPSFKLYSADATKEFEVRDLIAHDSGLPSDALDNLGGFGYSNDHAIYALRFVKPVAPFRTTYAYQSIFAEVAKNIIQKYSNEDFAANLHQKIFSPLGMNDSYVRTESVVSTLKNTAEPFAFYDGKNYPFTKNFPYLSKMWAVSPGVAGGGIRSNVIDVAKWLIFNINNGDINGKQLISKKNMDYMHSPQTIISASARKGGNVDGNAQAYGEGWFINTEEYKPNTVLCHAGGGTGMHAFMAYIPQAKIGIVILTNQVPNKVPEALYQRLFDLYFNKKPLKNWSEMYLKESGRNNKASIRPNQCKKIKSVDLEKYIGKYFNPVYGNLLMSKCGNHLCLSIGPQKITWQLTPCEKNVFKAYWPPAVGAPKNIPILSNGQDLISFATNKNGKIDKMTIPFLNGNGNGVFVKK